MLCHLFFVYVYDPQRMTPVTRPLPNETHIQYTVTLKNRRSNEYDGSCTVAPTTQLLSGLQMIQPSQKVCNISVAWDIPQDELFLLQSV